MRRKAHRTYEVRMPKTAFPLGLKSVLIWRIYSIYFQNPIYTEKWKLWLADIEWNVLFTAEALAHWYPLTAARRL
jgi:hypothetical protein